MSYTVVIFLDMLIMAHCFSIFEVKKKHLVRFTTQVP